MSVESSDMETGVHPDSASPSESQPADSVNPPAESKSAAEQPASQAAPEKDQRIPYDRFKEVIDSKNEMAEELKQLRAQLSSIDQRTKPQEPSMLDKAVEKLKNRGLEEDAAKALAETIVDLTKDYTDSKVRPVEEITVQQQMNSWVNEFKTQHKEDADELLPEMFNVYKALPENTQDALVSDPMALELLYAHAKLPKLQKMLEEKYKEGVQAAYESKQLKAGVASVPVTSAVPEGYTPEDIASMSLADYKKNREKILKILSNQPPA